MARWDYGEFYKQYDMQGDIHIGTGVVRVHDIFDPLPEFMKEADVVFCDPPYNQSALSSYYTKAGVPKRADGFEGFFYRFIECLDIIDAKLVILEVGNAQTPMYLKALHDIYKHIIIKPSYYYGNKSQTCTIICASNEPIPEALENLPFMDEEKVIEYICKNIEYSCIADPCMGKGLVGYYSNKYGKRFVGTELNPKRLAVCCERVTKNERGKIN